MAESPIGPLRTTKRLAGCSKNPPASFAHRSDPQRTTRVPLGPSLAVALLNGFFEHPAGRCFCCAIRVDYRSSPGPKWFSHILLENLQDETFQVPRFRHGGKDGMIAGLPALFKQTDLPFRISRSKADTRP